MNNELRQLKEIDRPAVIIAISTAREHGDLKENAEYHSAREKQGFIEGRIAELEAKASRSQAIDPLDYQGRMTVCFSATIKLQDLDRATSTSYQIVSDYEADVASGRISASSPLAQAVVGKSLGDEIEVNTPGGVRNYQILEILYI